MQRILVVVVAIVFSASTVRADVTVKATNTLPFARPSQTIELKKEALSSLGARSLREVHVTDPAGRDRLCQPVDTDFDDRRMADILIFQSDFEPGETKIFNVSAGKPRPLTEADFKAYGRFNRERFDDYQWENDRVAHRTYGKALQTWKGDPLTSSSIDIWSKRTPKLVTDRWFMHGDYHTDHGEGADFYSAGPTAGCGGAGLWVNGKAVWPANYVHSRTLAAGPIRVLFELDYDAFDAEGRNVSAVRRTQLDAGQNLNHILMTFKPESPGPLTAAVGLKKAASDKGANDHGKDVNQKHGWLTKFEDVEKKAGRQGLAVIIDNPSLITEHEAEDSRHLLLLVNLPDTNSLSYRTGFYWDKSGQFPDYDAWKKYVDEQALGIATPIEVTVGN